MSTNNKTQAAIFGASSITNIDFIKIINSSFLTVACDGGYYHFLKAKCEPDILVGDFDTLNENEIKNPGIIYKLSPIKDDTDVFWAIKFLIGEGYKEIHLYGCLGQKLDHTLANIELLSFMKEKGVTAYLHSPDNSYVLFVIQNEEVSFNPRAAGRISVFSLNEKATGVYETNLKYLLNNATLTNSVPLGVSNEFIGKQSSIKVTSGSLLIMTDYNNLNV